MKHETRPFIAIHKLMYLRKYLNFQENLYLTIKNNYFKNSSRYPRIL